MTIYPTQPTKDFNEWINHIYTQLNYPMNPDRTRIKDYLKNKAIRSQALYRIIPDENEKKGYRTEVHYEGMAYDENEFDLLYPVNLRPLSSSLDNPDSRSKSLL